MFQVPSLELIYWGPCSPHPNLKTRMKGRPPFGRQGTKLRTAKNLKRVTHGITHNSITQDSCPASGPQRVTTNVKKIRGPLKRNFSRQPSLHPNAKPEQKVLGTACSFWLLVSLRLLCAANAQALPWLPGTAVDDIRQGCNSLSSNKAGFSLYWDNGKENGNYYSIIGYILGAYYWDYTQKATGSRLSRTLLVAG